MSVAVTDSAWLTALGERVARLRLRRELTQADLAHQAGVSKRTMERIEAGESVQLQSALRVLRALGVPLALDAVVPSDAPSPMEQLRGQGRRKQRARVRKREPSDAAWAWGAEQAQTSPSATTDDDAEDA